MDCGPPGSSVHGIFQARILEWVPCPPPGAILDTEIEPASPAPAGRLFTTVSPGSPDSVRRRLTVALICIPLMSNGVDHLFMCLIATHIYIHTYTLLLSCCSRVRLCGTPWTAAHQAPPSLGFSRQEHWSGLPFPPPMHESEK